MPNTTISNRRRVTTLLAALLLLAASLTAGAPASASVGPTRVRIDAMVAVDKADIRLGAIADIQGGDLAVGDDLAEVIVGRAPLPGQVRRIARDYIAMRILQSGIALNRVTLQAPEQVTVARTCTRIPSERIRRMVVSFVKERFERDPERLRIGSINGLREVVLPAGHVEHRIEARGDRAFNGRTSLTIIFRVDGAEVQQLWITVEVDVLEDVVVSRRALRRHQRVSAEDVMLRTLPSSELPTGYISRLEQAVGKRTRRSVGSGQVLRTIMVERPPLVHRRNVVRIVALGEGMRITALGEAKETGCRGDVVRVVNLDSHRAVFARVVDVDTVEVEF